MVVGLAVAVFGRINAVMKIHLQIQEYLELVRVQASLRSNNCILFHSYTYSGLAVVECLPAFDIYAIVGRK